MFFYWLFREFLETDFIVTGGIDDSVKVWAWRNEQLELRHRLEGHALGVVSVDTSSDGKCNYIFIVYSLRNNISKRKFYSFQ
jgi:WD40 repeat protein